MRQELAGEWCMMQLLDFSDLALAETDLDRWSVFNTTLR